MSEEIDKLSRRLHRERLARKQAEQLLEDKSRELFDANQRLRALADDLEAQVLERTGQLEAALLQARAATQARGEFLAMMSHEIRTPLSGILGMAELLSDSEMDERQQGQLETIRRSGDDLLFLINDILDLSKIEAGKLDMERRSFEPDKEITSVVELYAARAQAKGIDLRLERRGQLPDALLGDSTRLRQIVSNLVSNALKFTESGSVVVGVEAVLDPAVTPVTAILQCDVSDTGIGIPADRVDLLFQPFTQGDSATTRRFGGTGLGLSICARLCEAMSGQISVVSKPGEGSRFSFTVRLPVAEKPTRAQAEPVECSAPNFAGARVLVVEDLEANRAVIKGMLARCGIACDEARDGLEGLERFRSSDPYDLIMMDIQMPRMDGLEAAQKIRAHEAAHGVGRTCVIALTAGVFHEERERYQAAGMDGLLAKPVKLSALRDCLQRWLTPRDRSVAS